MKIGTKDCYIEIKIVNPSNVIFTDCYFSDPEQPPLTRMVKKIRSMK